MSSKYLMFDLSIYFCCYEEEKKEQIYVNSWKVFPFMITEDKIMKYYLRLNP